MIIYPPLINDIVPAFIKSQNEIIIKIPFEQNPAVDFIIEEDNQNYMCLQIKDYKTSKLINSELLYTKIINKEKDNTLTAIFTIQLPTTFVIEENQYYKLQLAYGENLEFDNQECLTVFSDLTWSIAVVTRCISNQTKIYITTATEKDPNHETIMENSYEFFGVFDSKDNSDSLYSYQFDFIDENNTIIETSDMQLALGSNSPVSFTIKHELKPIVHYSIKFTTISANGVTRVAERLVKAADGILVYYYLPLEGKMNIDNGYVHLYFNNNSSISTNINACFVIERSEKTADIWYKITEFKMGLDTDISLYSWKDYSVEQGKTYIYRIRQYKTGKYSQVIHSFEITTDFEDMFLSDANYQLKIKFNPKVSSFKETLLEQKSDTLGSKYPYFFRNSVVQYKEFPISGLISYFMDEENLFINSEKLGLNDDLDLIKTTNLESYNIAAERIFKLKLLEWLNNGQPKLFRSPTEGNYVVRLMNISLSPNDQLGRMLHNFSCTAYECAAADLETLMIPENNLLNIKEYLVEEVKPTLWSGSFKDLLLLYPENNGISIIKNVKNFVWESSAPIYDKNKTVKFIKQDEEYSAIQNLGFVVKSQPEVVYDEIHISNLSQMDTSWFTFELMPKQYNEVEDDFDKYYMSYEWKTLQDDQIFIGNNKIIYHLQIVAKDLSKPAKAILNKESDIEEIVLDNQIRYYENITLESLELKNAMAIIYYSEKRMQNE